MATIKNVERASDVQRRILNPKEPDINQHIDDLHAGMDVVKKVGAALDKFNPISNFGKVTKALKDQQK